VISLLAKLMKLVEGLVQGWIVDVNEVSQDVIAAHKIEWFNGRDADFDTGDKLNACGYGEPESFF